MDLPGLPTVRSLPAGEYPVRVIHLVERDNATGHGSSDEEAFADLMRAKNNVPHAVLHLGGRVYVLDDSQEFHVGTKRLGQLTMWKYYKLHVGNNAGQVQIWYEEATQP